MSHQLNNGITQSSYTDEKGTHNQSNWYNSDPCNNESDKNHVVHNSQHPDGWISGIENDSRVTVVRDSNGQAIGYQNNVK